MAQQLGLHLYGEMISRMTKCKNFSPEQDVVTSNSMEVKVKQCKSDSCAAQHLSFLVVDM
jgi:hypothetical protein